MSSVSGRIGEFDVVNGKWALYCDRLQMHFLVNGTEEKLKIPTLISVIGDEAYELMVNLCSPKKPSEMKYTEVVEIMQSHLQPKSSILSERYKFRQCRQRAGQSVAEFVTELKKLSRHCEFGENLNENMRDQFVCGLLKDEMRLRLFTEDTIEFTKAVNVATNIERAERDAQSVEVDSRQRHPTINQLRAGGACGVCGGNRHSTSDCRFRNYICDRCGERGHLRRICRKEVVNKYETGRGPRTASGGGGRGDSHAGRGARRQQQRARGSGAARAHYTSVREEPEAYSVNQEVSECEDEEVEVMQMSIKEYKPVRMTLLVENRPLVMEIDTGSAISCISRKMYDDTFSRIPLVSSNLVLSFYDGSKVQAAGYIEVNVKYKNVNKVLDLYVIDNGTTCLLGRQWLAELKIDVPKFSLNKIDTEKQNTTNECNKIYSRYKELFDGSLGRFTGGRATLRVRQGATPLFCRARPVPYALRARVDAELDAMLRAGVIEPVDCSDWASPLVIASKADGGIRICADYKVTLNQVLQVDRYPVPKIDDLLSMLKGSKYYSKIDLSQAYNQIELDETRKYTVINTHRGLFMYNRLVYGLSSSPGIFQRIMSNLFKDIQNVVVFLDDILIFGDPSSHLEALKKVLERLSAVGLKIKKEKCNFFAESVKYLGFIINESGISVDTDKVMAIKRMTDPKNVSELRSFLGMVNFYGKFIKNLSYHVDPLYKLLKKNTDWVWGKSEKQAFENIKQMLGNTKTLDHYDESKHLIVTCDASARGVGAVLAQRDAGPAPGCERPVAFASRALTPAEQNYSQIHKEALAIIYAVKKFHQYLFGRSFTLRTDHKPLLSIFNPTAAVPSMTAARLQRWALTLSAYSFNIEYVRTDQNVADALSRMIASYKEIKQEEKEDCPEQTYLHFASEALLLDYKILKTETRKDPLLSRVISYLRDGWPTTLEIKELQPYYNRKNELYVELGCIMWGHRVVIPSNCRDKVLDELHDSHMGVVKTKSIARSYVWWPGIDEAVEGRCRACAVCAATAAAPPAHAPRPWPWPDRPWARLHLDFLGPIGGTTYLVIVDACSKWIEIVKMDRTTAGSVISKLREIFSRFGIPKQVVSDNGPPFSSEEFEKFLSDNGIQHIFSAPYHPASNGAAESAVKICKKIIKKAIVEKMDIDTALCRSLLVYRNTEHSATGESPAMLLMGRALRMRLDCLRPQRADVVRAAQERQQRAAGGATRALREGDEVYYRTYTPYQKWARGKVIQRLGETDYTIRGENGRLEHRHVDQIKNYHDCNLSVRYPCLIAGDDRIATPLDGPGESAGSLPAGAGPGLSTGERRYPLRVRNKPKRYGIDID